ncbi:MAG: hypothetical protein QM742_08235 [Aquabacterium sp.]
MGKLLGQLDIPCIASMTIAGSAQEALDLAPTSERLKQKMLAGIVFGRDGFIA